MKGFITFVSYGKMALILSHVMYIFIVTFKIKVYNIFGTVTQSS